jgi:predicted TPR repeat methyltransferase
MKNISKKIKNAYMSFFPSYAMELERIMKDGLSVLDVGCGSDSPLKYLKNKSYRVGVDGFSPSIKKSKKQCIHDEYIRMDICKIDKKIKENSYDVVLASDVIEHFSKKEGRILLKKMEKIARRKVVIFTPNGFLAQGRYEDNPWQVHRSGWTPKEMTKMGYKVIGISGLKNLRGGFSRLKYSPKFIWRVISDVSQLYARRNPSAAFAILCVKDIGK